MSRRIIALCGYPGSGKDSIAKVMCEEFHFTRVALADPMREMLVALDPYVLISDTETARLSTLVDAYGWDEIKRRLPDVRRLMQRMGTEAGRGVLGDAVWINQALRAIDAACGGVVITDLRFENEYQALAKRGAVFVHVRRPGFGPVNGHVSEQLDYVAIADYELVNDGDLDQLASKVRVLMRQPLPERLLDEVRRA